MFKEHIPVLLKEVTSFFADQQIERFVDGTLGLGGHAHALLDAHPEMFLLGIDKDADARKIAGERLAPFGERVEIIGGSFAELPWEEVDGVLLDLGVSSLQLDREEKGFSFKPGSPLDMRMDHSQELTAAQLLNTWSQEELAAILRSYGEIERSTRVAEAIVKGRPFHFAGELAEALQGIARSPRGRKIHPMTLIFQALRIAVNDELKQLKKGLLRAIDRLNSGGRLAVISFHSLEDRIVKEMFKHQAASFESDPTDPLRGRKDKDPTVNLLTKKPITASIEELKSNPRARSAKLRVVEKR
ncbi:MAG: 16S rRNA (cytosine(1402)-N(4))-methyltransferase RsmH [Verrucomicrobia bacterium]|nr:16S rRNA (cytosine(1402)-N(4))-methyltransferase RsmH [Verrucomicrobiota bacterium]